MSLPRTSRLRAPYVPVIDGVKTCPVCGKQFDARRRAGKLAYIEHYNAEHGEKEES